MMKLVLYYTEFCHLCEQAELLLSQAGLAETCLKLDIEDDEALLGQYGVHIPVLKRLDSGEELFWPFDADELESFLDVKM
jgi:hypothetical protein